jgi:hypothetical protein
MPLSSMQNRAGDFLQFAPNFAQEFHKPRNFFLIVCIAQVNFNICAPLAIHIGQWNYSSMHLNRRSHLAGPSQSAIG